MARQQAAFLAKGLAGLLAKGRPLQGFRFRNRGGLVTLGDYGAWGTLGQYGPQGGSVFEGLAAHAMLYRQHQIDLRGVLAGTAGWIADDLRRAAQPGMRV